MPAPSGTVWGSESSNSNGAGRIGIYAYQQNNTSTTIEQVIEVWYWTKWSVDDVANTFQVSQYGESFTTKSNVPIKHTKNSSWSTSNQTLIGTWSTTHNKQASSQKLTAQAKFSVIEYGGGSGSVSASYTIPALPTYTISYNGNGGLNVPNGQTKTHGIDIKLSSTVPTRTGHDFVGWGTSETDTTADYQAGSTYSGNANITLYAIWKAHTYSVTYDANGGTEAPSNQTKTYGVDLVLSSQIPKRTNYNFLGWGESKSTKTVSYQAGDTYTTNASKNLYAVWELGYIRPRINNVSIYRCDSDGNFLETGINAKIVFDYEMDHEANAYAVYMKPSEEGEYNSLSRVLLPAEETSGHVEYIIKNSTGANAEFDTEYSYYIQLNVADITGHSTRYLTLNSLFIAIDCTENGRGMCLGAPATEEDGLLRLAYRNVDLDPGFRLLYKGEAFFGQKALWSGNSLMTEASSITLPQKVSECKNGILLVFARNGDYNIISYFVPKDTVVSFGRTGWCFPLCTALFDYIGSKTLYIADDKIEGHADNDSTGKNATSGITYHNEAFFLRYVYAV